MKIIRMFRPGVIAIIMGACAFGQTDTLRKVGERMAQMGVGLSDVGNVEMLVENSNPFRQTPGKLGNSILLRESVLMLEPALEPLYFPATQTGCDVVDTNNAAYCRGDNTIYYDPIFLAAVQKQVGKITHTDGSYAVLAIIAHELGHAIAYRRYLDYNSIWASDTFAREQYADCAAGALTADAQRAGVWPAGAEVEGRAALDLLSDAEFSPYGHGTAGDRVRIFNQGYQGGKGNLGFCTFTSPKRFLFQALQGNSRP